MTNNVSKVVTNSEANPFLVGLQNRPNEEQVARLTTYIEDVLLELLRPTTSITRESLSRGFVAVGLDSMLAIELLYRIERDFGVAIAAEALEVDSVDELVQYLLESVVRPGASRHELASG